MLFHLEWVCIYYRFIGLDVVPMCKSLISCICASGLYFLFSYYIFFLSFLSVYILIYFTLYLHLSPHNVCFIFIFFFILFEQTDFFDKIWIGYGYGGYLSEILCVYTMIIQMCLTVAYGLQFKRSHRLFF